MDVGVLGRWAKPYLWLIVLGLISVAVSGAVTLLMLQQIQQVAALWPSLDSTSWRDLALAVSLRACFGLLGAYGFGWLAARALTDYRQRLFIRLIQAPLSYHDQAWSANLVSALTNDAAFIQEVLGRVLPTLALHGPAVIIVLGLLLQNNAPLLFGVLLVAGPLALGMASVGRRMRALTRHGQQLLGQTAIAAQESFGGVRFIKALTREDFFAERFANLTEKHFQSKRQLMFWQALLNNATAVALLILGGWGAWLAGQQLSMSQTTAAALSTFAVYLAILASSSLALIQAYISIEPAIGAYQRLWQLSGQVSRSETSDGLDLTRTRGSLSLRDVTFEYPGRRVGVYGINLDIAAGETVALIGQNGAGKSTLIQLLLRFYTPQHGQICLDGHVAETVSLASWRRQFALVTRDPYIFDLSVAENIRLGRPEASQIEIERAAQAVQMHDYIAALPQGYRSRVGEGGAQLSAGQRQRLALARIFLQDPAIIIFDEATTSLDRESEQALMEALRLWAGQRTLVFVSHQPISAWQVSRVIYLEAGRLVRF